MRICKIILRFYGTALKNIFEYRLGTLLDVLTFFLRFTFAYLTIWILLLKFQNINGWTLYEVMFLFNLNMFANGLESIFFFSPMQGMEQMVQYGEFDMALIRPLNPLVYTLIGRPTLAFAGNFILGIIVFVLCFTHLGIYLTAIKVVFLLLVILGGILIHCAKDLFFGSLSFWIVKTRAISSVISCFNTVIDYPISIYGKVLQTFLTFLLPLAFVNFYPAQYFLGKTADSLFDPVFQYGTPVVGVVLFFLAYQFWKIGVNKYESTGS